MRSVLGTHATRSSNSPPVTEGLVERMRCMKLSQSAASVHLNLLSLVASSALVAELFPSSLPLSVKP